MHGITKLSYYVLDLIKKGRALTTTATSLSAATRIETPSLLFFTRKVFL